MRLVQLTGQEHKLPGQLSGGQQQRVAIARAIVIEPPLILMDEPLSNLDAKLRLETRAEIRRIHRELGRATIYVTHDQDEALSLADRIVVMKDGVVQQIAAPGGSVRTAGEPARRALHGLSQRAATLDVAGESGDRVTRRSARHQAHRRAQAAARRQARGGRDPAGGDDDRQRCPRRENVIAGRVDNVEYGGRDSLVDVVTPSRHACCTCARRSTSRWATRCTCTCRPSACSCIRRERSEWRRDADARAARAVRPDAAAGRAGGAVHGAAVHLSVPLRPAAVVRAEARRRARELPQVLHDRQPVADDLDHAEARAARDDRSTSASRCRSLTGCATKTRYQRWVTTHARRADHARHRADRRRHADLFRPEGLAVAVPAVHRTSTTARSASRTTTGAC